MQVQALGYVGVRAKSLEDWAGYGQNFLGLQKIDKTRNAMAFRMDDRKQRIVVDVDGGQGISFFGWEVADAAALDALAARLEKSGTKVARGSRADLLLMGAGHNAESHDQISRSAETPGNRLANRWRPRTWQEQQGGDADEGADNNPWPRAQGSPDGTWVIPACSYMSRRCRSDHCDFVL